MGVYLNYSVITRNLKGKLDKNTCVFFFSVPNAYQYRASKYFSERLFRGNAYQVRKLPAGSGTLIPRERLPSLEVAFYA